MNQNKNLARWYRESTVFPLFGAYVVLVLVLFTFCAYFVHLKYVRIDSGLKGLSEVVNFSMRQNNRMLLENQLESVKTSTNAQSISICSDEQVVMSTNPQMECFLQGIFFLHKTIKVVGFEQFYIAASYDYTNMFFEPAMALLFAAAFMSIIFGILRQTKIRIEMDLLKPIESLYTSDSVPDLVELANIKVDLMAAKNNEVALVASEKVAQIASQVAHDIRSPLSAINIICYKISCLNSEEFALLKSSTNRINEIARDLLALRKDSFKNDKLLKFSRSVMIDNLENSIYSVDTIAEQIELLVQEKNMEFGGSKKFEIEFINEIVDENLVLIDMSKFKRIISNLMNNSIEAIDKKYGKVVISLLPSSCGNYIQIEIEDNGKGIPDELVAQIGKLGLTVGREDRGTGIGLASSIAAFKIWGGRLVIKSQLGSGTTVMMYLPIERSN